MISMILKYFSIPELDFYSSWEKVGQKSKYLVNLINI